MSKRSRPASPSPKQQGGEKTHGQMQVWLSRGHATHCERLRPGRISEVLSDPEAILWVDVRNPDSTHLDLLQREFGFHHLALEDVAKQRQRPKVDEYPGYYFVVLYAPVPGTADGSLETTELDLFIGRNYVVTVRRGEIPSLQEAMKRWERTEPALREHVGFLVHVIADSVVDSYFPIVDALEDQLDQVELGMFGPGAAFDAEELLAIKRTLYTLRKAIYPLREVFNVFLRREGAVFQAETYPYFQDVYDHILRLLDTIDIERDMATGALEAQLSIVSNRLNETMKRLTVVAICVAVIGAVFGAWGMNFDAVPLHEMGQTGFYLIAGTAVLLVGIALAVAKRLRLW